MSLCYTLPASVSAYRKWVASNWASGKWAIPAPPVVACTWSKVLKQLRLNERDVLTVLESTTEVANYLRCWIRQNYMRRFVPEQILYALGIDEAQVLRDHKLRGDGGAE